MPKGKETILVHRRVAVDRLDPDAGAETTREQKRCIVIPAASKEDGKGWIQVFGYTVVAPKGADIEADDEVTVRGDRMQVVGKPGVYPKQVIVNVGSRASSDDA